MMKTIYKFLPLSFLAFLLMLSVEGYSHAVQAAYGVDCDGNLVLYIEHWHGTEDPNSTTMTIDLTINGVTTTINGSPNGTFYNTPLSGLSGSGIPIVVFATSSSSNTYNDWVTYNFGFVPGGSNVTITIISGNTVFTDGAGGSSLSYPATVSFVAPAFTNTPEIIAPQTVCGGQPFNPTLFVTPSMTTWANNNTATGIPASGAGNIAAVVSNTTLVNQTSIITFTSGCSTNTLQLNVNANPDPLFTFPVSASNNQNNYCLNSTIAFTPSNSTNNINSASWNFGDGNTSNVLNSSNSFTATGIYTVQLNVTGVNSCTATSTNTLSVYTPTANFTVANNCLNVVTPFTSTSSSPQVISSQVWNFGDGTPTGTGTAPNHTYANTGTFNANLLITAVDGCTATVSNSVTIYPNPIIAISVNTVCLTFSTAFTNTSSVAAPDVIATWAWDFDNNGTTDNSTQSPSTIFATSGIHTVELKATSNNNCRDSALLNIMVNASPTATFTPVNACLNSNVLLNNTSNIALPNNISTYAWSFGAGATPTTTTNIQNPPILSYNSSGIKTITLLITANTTCTASITQTVEVYPQPVANFSTTSVCQSTATVYTDLSTTSLGTITGWQWDFTNNNSIDNTTNAPTNVFVTSGTFTTSLIATNSNGCKDTIALPLNVWGHTIPNFSPDNVCFGTANTFTNLTNETTNPNVGVGTTYLWDFTDGNSSTAISPNHTYTMGGNANAIYNVLLVATSQHNCIDSIRKTVNVYAVPTASFTSDSVCLGSASQMADASNGNGNIVNTYKWDFLNDGTVDVSGVPNPNFIFPNYGNNLVSYTVSSSPVVGLVCANTTNSITVWVNPNPVPDFTFVNKCINAQPNTFNGSPSTIAIGTNATYYWAYGDGAVSTPTVASVSTHTYLAAGVYNVTLIVTSNKGCQSLITKQTEVFEKPYMKIASTSACDQSAMTFTSVSLPNSGTIVYWFWDFNNTITTIEGTTQTTSFTFVGAGAQTVALIGETNKGCRDTISKVVYVNYIPVAVFSGDKLSGCPIPKHCVNFTDASPAITGPAQISQWQWSLGDGTTLTNPTSASVNHCYGNSSSSQLALFNVSLVLTTDSGCVSPINNKVNYITVYPTPIAAYTVNPNPGNILTPLEYFTNQSIDYTKWWWSFGDGPFKMDSINVDPTHFYGSESAGTYYSNLIVMNQYGCSDTAYVAIEIQPEFTFYIPNAFTPGNKDNINDIFTGIGIGIDKFEMWIFDRWGERVFYTDDILKAWDGNVQGKDGEEKQDVYIWKVKIKDVLGKKHEYVGHVTLLR